MAWYPYSYKTAFDPTTGEKAPAGSAGQIYAIGDTGFTTPLQPYDLAGLPVELAVQGDLGYIPTFQVEDETSVVWKSGDYIFEFTTTMPLPGPEGARIVNATDNGDGTMSFELSDGSTVGPIPIPKGPVLVDGDTAANINDPDSATTTALTGIYATLDHVNTLAYGTDLEATDSVVSGWVGDLGTLTGQALAETFGPVPASALDATLANLGAWSAGDPIRVVTVKPGDYTRSTPISVPSGVTLYLYGCRFTLTDGAYCDVLTNSDWVNGNSHITVMGGDLDGNVAGNPDNVTQPNGGLSGVTIINAQHVTLRDINTHNTRLHGIDLAVRDYVENSYSDNTSHILVENCRVTGFGDDGISTHWSKYVQILNCTAHDPAPNVGAGSNSHGLEIDDGSQDIMVDGFVAYNCDSGIQVQSHAGRGGGERWQLQNCYSFNNYRGYNLVNDSAQVMRGAALINCTAQGNTATGLNINNHQNVTVTGFRSVGNFNAIEIAASRDISVQGFQIYAPQEIGVNLADGAATSGVSFTDGVIEGTPNIGIFCTQTGVSFTGIRLVGCGTAGNPSVRVTGQAAQVNLTDVSVVDGAQDAFQVLGDARDVQLTRCNAVGVGNQYWALAITGTGTIANITASHCRFTGWTTGVRYAASNATNVRLLNNDLTGNNNAYVGTNGSTDGLRIEGNVGYLTAARGTATIPDASTAVDVAHGLATTPGVVTVTPQSGQQVWVSARTASTFTLTRSGSSGALAVDFRADV